MPFPIIPALIAAGSAIAGGAMGSASNRKTNQTNLQIARETNQMNYQLFQESNAFNEKMYHEANAYNTPSAQMQRYAEAGINPYIAAGNVQTGNTTSALQSAPAPQMHAAQMQPDVNMANGMMSAGTIISQYAQNELAIAQARKTNAEANWIDRLNTAYVGNMNAHTGVLNSQNGLLDLDFKIKHDTLGNYIKLSDLSVANAQETNKSLILQNVHQDIENKLSNINLGIQDKYAEQMFKAQFNSILVHSLSEWMHIGFDQQNANTNRMNANTNRMDANTNRMNANTNRMNADTNRMNANTNSFVGNAQVFNLMNGAFKTAAETVGVKIDNSNKNKLFNVTLRGLNLDNINKAGQNVMLSNQIGDYSTDKWFRRLGMATDGAVGGVITYNAVKNSGSPRPVGFKTKPKSGGFLKKVTKVGSKIGFR